MKIRKNGKVINLTESDLRRIVKRVMNEQVGMVHPKFDVDWDKGVNRRREGSNKECGSLMEWDGRYGSSPKLDFPRGSKVEVVNDRGSMSFVVDGQPFCKISAKTRPNPGGRCDLSSPLSGRVSLEKFSDGGPKYEEWVIYENGQKVCSFSKV